MEVKSRTFTVYLLHEGIVPLGALRNQELLEQDSKAQIPQGALLYLTRRCQHSPWWKEYLGISRNIAQVYPGGILFIPVGKRWFAATFGQSYHHLSSSAYECDFGLRVALNMTKRDSLRSTDVVNPETARRERIQAPKDKDLSFFSFNGDDTTVLKKITGHVQDQYADLASSVTGCDNIRVTTKKSAEELVMFCQNLLGLYGKEDAERNFPEVFNIRPEKDKSLLDRLDLRLLEAVKQKDPSLILSYPDIVNYQDQGQVKFGRLPAVDPFTIESFWDVIPEDDLCAITIERLKSTYDVCVMSMEGKPINKTIPSFYKCLIFECAVDGKYYHFCEGKWYCVNQDLIENLRACLDPLFEQFTFLPAYTSRSENEYNASVAKSSNQMVLFDKKLYKPPRQTPIELCDLCYFNKNECPVSLIHVKVGVHSSSLSHLFSQGYVGSKLLLYADIDAVAHFEKTINNESKLNAVDREYIVSSVRSKKFRVVFAIVTKKAQSLKSDALPLFSRINLRRMVETMKAMSIPVKVCLISY